MAYWCTEGHDDGLSMSRGFYPATDLSGYYTKKEIDDMRGRVEVEGSEVTQELKPGILYVFGEVTSLTLTFASGDTDIREEYMFEFTSGATPTTLSLPDDVKWIGDSTIEASKTYQVSIVNNIAVMGGAA